MIGLSLIGLSLYTVYQNGKAIDRQILELKSQRLAPGPGLGLAPGPGLGLALGSDPDDEWTPPWGVNTIRSAPSIEQQTRSYMLNPLIPPMKSSPMYGPEFHFQQVGYIENPRNHRIHRLFGRKLDSARHQYYAIDSKTGIKLEIETKTPWELYTGDEVKIVGRDKVYRVFMYGNDAPSYFW